MCTQRNSPYLLIGNIPNKGSLGILVHDFILFIVSIAIGTVPTQMGLWSFYYFEEESGEPCHINAIYNMQPIRNLNLLSPECQMSELVNSQKGI